VRKGGGNETVLIAERLLEKASLHPSSSTSTFCASNGICALSTTMMRLSQSVSNSVASAEKYRQRGPRLKDSEEDAGIVVFGFSKSSTMVASFASPFEPLNAQDDETSGGGAGGGVNRDSSIRLPSSEL
jgi:hypothetical protein